MFLLALALANPYPLNPVIRSASTQIGRSDRDCPKPGCYGGTGRNWCSEFVSWANREAGTPFDGGRAPSPWLLRDAKTISDWYRKHGQFLKRDSKEFQTYSPTPGDYVLIGSLDSTGNPTSRRHSGIIESVSRDGNLHTLEGNHHGAPVGRYSYPDYLRKSRNPPSSGDIILGIGTRERK
jgi:hypothetical protein